MIDKKALIVIDMQNDYLWDKKTMFSYDTESFVDWMNVVALEPQRRV